MEEKITPKMIRKHACRLARKMNRSFARDDGWEAWLDWASEVVEDEGWEAWLDWASEVVEDLAEFLHRNPDITPTIPVIVNWFQNRGFYSAKRMADPSQRAVIAHALMAFASEAK